MIGLTIEDENLYSLARSILIAGLTFLFLSTFVVNPLVTNAMIESQILSNGRYAIVYDAHETIEEFEEFKATAIGSSIIRDGGPGPGPMGPRPRGAQAMAQASFSSLLLSLLLLLT